MRVFLLGFMGAGKSATGRALAHRLDALFVDLDDRIAAAFGRPIPEIFACYGESSFRAEESRQLAAAARLPRVVVAAGGGTFEREENRAVITASGRSVFLDVAWDEILRRLPGKRDERPMFKSPENAYELYRRRLANYRRADLTIVPQADEDPEAVAGRIVLALGQVR